MTVGEEEVGNHLDKRAWNIAYFAVPSSHWQDLSPYKQLSFFAQCVEIVLVELTRE